MMGSRLAIISLFFRPHQAADYDTYFRAKNSAGTDVDTDSEVTDETPHTLEVTADGTTTYLEVEVQDWASAASDNPTAATFTLTHTPVAPATDGTENNPHIITTTDSDINVSELVESAPTQARKAYRHFSDITIPQLETGKLFFRPRRDKISIHIFAPRKTRLETMLIPLMRRATIRLTRLKLRPQPRQLGYNLNAKTGMLGRIQQRPHSD